MKNIFLWVMIFSLLVMVCGCEQTVSSGSDETPELVTPEVVSPETEQPEIVPPEIVPPEVVPPDVVPPEVVPPEIVPPEIVPPEVVPPKVVPPKMKTHKVRPQRTKKPNIKTPEIVPPDDGTQEDDLLDDETPDIEAPEDKTPEDGTQEGETEETKPPQDCDPEISLLEITELNAVYSKSPPHAEFIEFKVIKAGNLEGLYLYIMNDPIDPFIYVFPPADVQKGEYITLHLRTLESANADETGADLSLSGGNDSCPTARDLWVAGNTKWLYKSEIVCLQDGDGTIIDAVVMNETPGKMWNANLAFYDGITENLYNCGMWKSTTGNKPTPLDAVDTSTIGTSVYKSVCRYEGRENTHSAKDWYITDNTATPGRANQ